MPAELASPQLIELGQLVGERMHITHVGFTDGLDLPLGAVQIAIPACIATMALERPVLGVDVELDTPASDAPRGSSAVPWSGATPPRVRSAG